MADLELIEHRRPPGSGRYEWQPYADDANFNRGWWHIEWDLEDRYSLWSVRQGGLEVARLQLDQEVYYDHYAEVPGLGPQVLEIDFIEVSAAFRGSGLGRRVLHLVAEHFPTRRLLAFSELADGFWAGQSWARYDHPQGFPAYRPLFVAHLDGACVDGTRSRPHMRPPLAGDVAVQLRRSARCWIAPHRPRCRGPGY